MATQKTDYDSETEKKLDDTDVRVTAGTSDEYLTHQLPEQGSPERIEAERRLVKKLDMRLLPMVFLIYVMNYIDRNNITTARLKGFQQDLHLSNVQYASLLAAFYGTYAPFQIPSNMLINYVSRPSIYIGVAVAFWGLTSLLTGVTKSFGGALTCRIFIGIPEAAFYPGATYLLSRWYTRKELAFRASIMFCGFLLANAFGSLMAAGILSNMEGDRGIRAWRWLFYIEGSITICVGFISMWVLPDYPHNTRWIKGTERRLVMARLAEDAAEADMDDIAASRFYGSKLALKDPVVILFSLMQLLQFLGLSFVNFFPTLTATLGFDTTVTLLMAAPPWAWSSLVLLWLAWHADRTGERFFHITLTWLGVIVGYIIGLSTRNVAARYVALFLMASGYAGFALVLIWVSNAIPRPPAKRAASMGIVNGIGTLGNLIGSYVWDAKWSPDYHPSMWICLASMIGATVLALVIRQLVIRRNDEMIADELRSMSAENKARVEEAARIEGISFEDAMSRRRGFKLLY